MVVCAVEDVLVRMGTQGAVKVHYGKPQGLRLLQKGGLVPAGGSGGQVVLPDLRRRRDESQVHGDVRVLRQPLHIGKVFLVQALLRVFYLGNETVTTQIHIVELGFADQLLRPCLEHGPLVPQGELVGKVLLHGAGEAAVLEGLPGKRRPLAQRPVLHLGALPVRQD